MSKTLYSHSDVKEFHIFLDYLPCADMPISHGDRLLYFVPTSLRTSRCLLFLICLCSASKYKKRNLLQTSIKLILALINMMFIDIDIVKITGIHTRRETCRLCVIIISCHVFVLPRLCKHLCEILIPTSVIKCI
jgi:hypothetical protein